MGRAFIVFVPHCSENAKNFQLDGARIKQVNKATSKPGHAYGKFSTGMLSKLCMYVRMYYTFCSHTYVCRHHAVICLVNL